MSNGCIEINIYRANTVDTEEISSCLRKPFAINNNIVYEVEDT